MPESSKLSDIQQVSCDICLEQVPPSGAKSVETTDYVAHFCGLECYEQWKEREKEQADQTVEQT